MPNPTLAKLADDLEAGRISSRKLVEECLARIADPAGEGQRTFIVNRNPGILDAEGLHHLARLGEDRIPIIRSDARLKPNLESARITRFHRTKYESSRAVS